MVRTVSRLRAPGVQTVAIDLTAIGTTGISVNEWYFGLIGRFKQQLGLRVDELAWWQERDQLGPTQRSPIFFARSC
jgi:hypothetical protein